MKLETAMGPMAEPKRLMNTLRCAVKIVDTAEVTSKSAIIQANTSEIAKVKEQWRINRETAHNLLEQRMRNQVLI